MTYREPDLLIVIGDEDFFNQYKDTFKTLAKRVIMYRPELYAGPVHGTDRTSVLFLPYWKRSYTEDQVQYIYAVFTAMSRDTGTTL